MVSPQIPNSIVMKVTDSTISQGGSVQQTDANIYKEHLQIIIMNENCLMLIQISIKYVPNGPINIGPILAQMMYSHWISNKDLFYW